MSLPTARGADVFCVDCGASLPAGMFNSGTELSCGNCGAKLGVEVFPALYRQAEVGKRGDAVTAEGEASCYFHPHKKAVAICSSCGCFICSLCETELAGACLCPSCIDKGRQSETVENLISQRTLHDSLALSVAILPLLFFPLTVVSAPLAMYLVIRHWKKPGSILPRSKIRFVCAFLIALAQVCGWIAVLGLSLFTH